MIRFSAGGREPRVTARVDVRLGGELVDRCAVIPRIASEQPPQQWIEDVRSIAAEFRGTRQDSFEMSSYKTRRHNLGR